MKNLTAAYCLYVKIVGSTASCLLCISLLDASIKSMLLLILAAMICFAMTLATAATRHLLWTSTVLGLLLLPMFALCLPEWRILPEWLLVENREEMDVHPVSGQAVSKWSDHIELDHTEVEPPLDRPRPVGPTANSEFSASELSHQVAEPKPDAEYLSSPISLRLNASLILVIWSVGVLVGLSPFVVSIFQLYRLEKAYSSSEKLDSRISNGIKSISHRLGIQVPLVLLGPEGTMPMVWSFARSRILLPSDMASWSESKRNVVLLHELIHLRRYDPLVCSFALIARALNWFNPLAWYAIKRLRTECELACDDHVLQMGVEPSDYASHLLELSTNMRFSSAVGPLSLAMSSRPCVEERILAILNEKRNRQGVTVNRVAATLIGSVVFAGLLAMIATRAAVSNEFRGTELTKIEVASEEATEVGPETLTLQEPVTKQETAGESKPNKRSFEVLDLSLEECIVYALNNTKVILPLPGREPPTQQSASKDSDRELRSHNSFDLEQVRNAIEAKGFGVLPWIAMDDEGRTTLTIKTASGGMATIRAQSIATFNNIPTQAIGFVGTPNVSWLNLAEKFESESQIPIIRGRAPLGNGHTIVLSRINEDISTTQFEERVQNLVRDVEFAYWDLYAAYLRVETAKLAVDSTAVAWKTCASHKSASANNAETQARAVYLQFTAQYNAAIAGTATPTIDLGLYGRERNLRLLLGWADMDGRLIRPSDHPAVGQPGFDWVSILEETQNRNIDLLQEKSDVTQLEIDLEKAKKQFGKHRTVQDKQLALARERRVLAAKEIAAEQRLRAMLQQVELLHKRMTLQFRLLDAAQNLVALSQSKCESTDTDHIEANIDNLTRALQTRSIESLNFILAMMDYNKSLVELHAIKGSLLRYNSMQIESASKSDK